MLSVDKILSFTFYIERFRVRKFVQPLPKLLTLLVVRLTIFDFIPFGQKPRDIEHKSKKNEFCSGSYPKLLTKLVARLASFACIPQGKLMYSAFVIKFTKYFISIKRKLLPLR